jgi:hypothetical protein
MGKMLFSQTNREARVLRRWGRATANRSTRFIVKRLVALSLEIGVVEPGHGLEGTRVMLGSIISKILGGRDIRVSDKSRSGNRCTSLREICLDIHLIEYRQKKNTGSLRGCSFTTFRLKCTPEYERTNENKLLEAGPSGHYFVYLSLYLG